MTTKTTLKWDGSRRKSAISYHRYEEPRIKKMERDVMEHYGYNKSQMYKTLLQERHQQLIPLI